MQRHVGVTADLKRQLAQHNAEISAHTSKFMPWRFVTYVAFSDQSKAAAFERYPKSGSGHAFAKCGAEPDFIARARLERPSTAAASFD
jgi:putative endonuclease